MTYIYSLFDSHIRFVFVTGAGKLSNRYSPVRCIQNLKPDDISYLVDLGLITQERSGALAIANPIYQEIIPRELSYTAQSRMSLKAAWYIGTDGSIQVYDLLVSFQCFSGSNADDCRHNHHHCWDGCSGTQKIETGVSFQTGFRHDRIICSRS